MERLPHQLTPPDTRDTTRPLRLQNIKHPQFSTPVQATISQVDSTDDEQATAQTIHLMAQYAREDSRSPIVRRAAAEAAGLAEDNSAGAIAVAVWRWIRTRVRFQLDSTTAAPVTSTPDQAELLIRPVDLLTMPQPAGDCDDQSMLCAAMLRALGIDSAYKTVAADPSAPDLYSHVYVVADTPEGGIALDCSHGPKPGWEVQPAGKTRTWRIEDMHHLGDIDWGAILQTGVQAGADIAKARYAQPPEGTYIQQGNNVVYRQPAGSSPLTYPGVGLNIGGSSTGTSLLLIVGAVVLLIALTRK
jgi:hypothetical protein